MSTLDLWQMLSEDTQRSILDSLYKYGKLAGNLTLTQKTELHALGLWAERNPSARGFTLKYFLLDLMRILDANT